MTVIMGSQAATNDREQRGYLWIWSGVAPVIGVDLSLPERAIQVFQQTPWHPRSFLFSSNPLPSVSISVDNSVNPIIQEQPPFQSLSTLKSGAAFQAPVVTAIVQGVFSTQEHSGRLPQSSTNPGVQGSNVYQPTGIPRVVKGTQAESLSRDFRGQFWLLSGIQGSNVGLIALPTIGGQEQPSHPSSRIFVGITTATSIAIENPLITYREQPFHPASIFFSNIPLVGISISASLIISKQEYPWHPSSYVSLGTVSYSVFGPGITEVIHDGSLQEQPIQYVSIFKPSIPGLSVGPSTLNQILGKVETPDQPKPIVLPGTPPVTQPVPSILRSLFVKQEQPSHPPSVFVIGASFVPTMFLSAELRYIITRQEFPSHPGSLFNPGVFPSTVPGLIGRSVGTAQQLPDHPLPRFGIGIQGPNVGMPETRSIIIGQERPIYNASLLFAGQIASFVPPPGLLLIKQELPGHPNSIILSSSYVSFVAFPFNKIVMQQELPDHPGPRLFPGRFPSSVPAIIGVTNITRQQLPDHPSSTFGFGVQTAVIASLQGRINVTLEIPSQSQSIMVGAPIFGLPAVAVSATVTVSSWGSKTKIIGIVR